MTSKIQKQMRRADSMGLASAYGARIESDSPNGRKLDAAIVESLKAPRFAQGFADFACEGDSIRCCELAGGLYAIATLYRDDDATPPDKRCDGFWPSLDPQSAGYIGAKSRATLRRHTIAARKILETWKRDEWFYCGIAVQVFTAEGEELTGKYENALWGIECNYPFGRQRNRYLTEVANELLPDAFADAMVTLKRHAMIAAQLEGLDANADA